MDTSLEPRNYSLHLIGLGGAGANILEEFFRHGRIFDFLKRSGVKVSCLALDVADHDIQSLQNAYDNFLQDLKARGIPSEKVSLIARSVKFPTPEAMFEFLERLPEYLRHESVRGLEKYSPWLSSSMDIPPLSGGVGRRRALSKAIYGLNYYYLKIIDSYAERFKEAVSASTLQPVIFVIFGVGGGSGGGMAVDFTRHLRRKLGSGFPIIGLGILPCQGDDPPARGAAAYAALNELELFMDKRKNEAVKKAYGQAYENPFTALLMMPLGPPFSKSGNLLDAKKVIDGAIVDILINSLRFDLSDLLNNIASNIDLGDKWIHTITSLKVSYPIDEHMALAKLHLEKLDKLRLLRRDKLEVGGGSIAAGTGGLLKVIAQVHRQLRDIYRFLLTERGVYEERAFDKALADYVYEDHSVDMTLNLQLKGAEETILTLLDEVLKPISTIGLDAPEGTPEARIRRLASEIAKQIKTITTTHPTYHQFTERIVDDMNTSIRSAQKLTFREKLLLNDLLDFVKLIDVYIKVLRHYLETKTLADRLQKEISKTERTEAREKLLATVQRIQNPILTLIFSLIPSITASPTAELKAVDSNLSEIRLLRRALAELLEKLKINRETLEAKIRALQNEGESILSELKAIKMPFFKAGRKSFLKQKAAELERELSSLKIEFEDLVAQLVEVEGMLNECSIIERRFDVNSEYRRLLREAAELDGRYYDKLNEVSRDRGYYDRVAEIAEEERLRIMQKILREEEATLTRETILREIVDRKRLKDYLVGVMRILRIPSTLGVTNEYRTDYIWLTVVAPRGIWDHELDSDLKATLSGYISGDAAKSITIREIDSTDPWTIRFLIISSKASRNRLDIFRDMKTLYEQSSKDDVLLAHSLLLEHGIIVNEGYLKSLMT